MLYGQPAARGSKDSIKSRAAGPRAPLRGELTFTLAGQRYRVVRTLSSAECYLGDSETPIANSLSGVSDQITRALGMTRTEFFNTYFTGQKELAVMASLGAADRARFLSRVLGYDLLEQAQALVRERRSALSTEIKAIRATMPEQAVIERQQAEAAERVTATSNVAFEAERRKADAETALREDGSQWQAIETAWDRRRSLLAERATVLVEQGAAARDAVRLGAERAAIAEAVQARPLVEAAAAPAAALRAELSALEARAAAQAEHQRRDGQRQGLRAQLADVETRLVELTVAGADVADAEAAVDAAETRHDAIRKEREAAYHAWQHDCLNAARVLSGLRSRARALKAKIDELVARGADSPCETCGQALGANYESVLARMRTEFAELVAEGNAANAREESIRTTEPETLRDLVEARTVAGQAVETARATLATLREQRLRRFDAEAQQARLTAQLAALDSEVAVAGEAVDPAAMAALREQIAAAARAEAQLAVLIPKCEREDAAMGEHLEAAERQRTATDRLTAIDAEVEAIALTDGTYAAARGAHERVVQDDAQAKSAYATAVQEAARAQDAKRWADEKATEFAARIATVSTLERDRTLHEALDQALGDLRTDLNSALRPELSEIASELLETLTDGRYGQADLGEDYQLVVIDNGSPKPVISGGEEDLCNFVLRLAISQMISQRAGQSFSLLIMDEIFASLDEQRRANVMTLLRRLQDRFQQVVLITHDSGVKDTVDHALIVRYDRATDTSTVTTGGEMLQDLAMALPEAG